MKRDVGEKKDVLLQDLTKVLQDPEKNFFTCIYRTAIITCEAVRSIAAGCS